jgi:hypothetical protein
VEVVIITVQAAKRFMNAKGKRDNHA